MLKKTYQKGFTIVELLIVIVVIGILAALVLNTFAGVQQRARDTERTTDVKAIASQLEVYYADNGHYPSHDQLTNSTWRNEHMPGVDEGAFTAPQQEGNSITDGFGVAAAPDKDHYKYTVSTDDGTPADCEVTNPTTEEAVDCQIFSLSWTPENEDETTQTVNSLN